MTDIFTIAELAAIIKAGPRTVAKLVKAKAIPSSRFARCTRVRARGFMQALPRFYVGSEFKAPSAIPRDWLKPVDVSETFHCSKATVLRWVRMRRIPFYRFGEHTIRFRASEIEAWIQKQEAIRD